MAEDKLKDYIQVNERIIKFYEKYPEGSIQTEIIEAGEQRIIMKASAFRDREDTRPGTGHAEEVRGSTYINKTNPLENCETSAIGRALAALGFEVKHSIASREEVASALQKQADIEAHEQLEKEKRGVFAEVKKIYGDYELSKDDLLRVTNKESSKDWTKDDLEKIKNFLKIKKSGKES